MFFEIDEGQVAVPSYPLPEVPEQGVGHVGMAHSLGVEDYPELSAVAAEVLLYAQRHVEIFRGTGVPPAHQLDDRTPEYTESPGDVIDEVEFAEPGLCRLYRNEVFHRLQ